MVDFLGFLRGFWRTIAGNGEGVDFQRWLLCFVGGILQEFGGFRGNVAFEAEIVANCRLLFVADVAEGGRNV